MKYCPSNTMPILTFYYESQGFIVRLYNNYNNVEGAAQLSGRLKLRHQKYED